MKDSMQLSPPNNQSNSPYINGKLFDKSKMLEQKVGSLIKGSRNTLRLTSQIKNHGNETVGKLPTKPKDNMDNSSTRNGYKKIVNSFTSRRETSISKHISELKSPDHLSARKVYIQPVSHYKKPSVSPQPGKQFIATQSKDTNCKLKASDKKGLLDKSNKPQTNCIESDITSQINHDSQIKPVTTNIETSKVSETPHENESTPIIFHTNDKLSPKPTNSNDTIPNTKINLQLKTSHSKLSLVSYQPEPQKFALQHKAPCKSKSLPSVLSSTGEKIKRSKRELRKVKRLPLKTTAEKNDKKVLASADANGKMNAFYQSNDAVLQNLKEEKPQNSYVRNCANENAFSRLRKVPHTPNLPKIGKMYTKLQKDAVQLLPPDMKDMEDYERPFILGDRIQNFINKHSKEKFERSWCNLIPIRRNQDIQREYEEKIMKILEEKTAELCGFQKFVERKVPSGGIFLSLEDDWKIENKIGNIFKEKNLSGSSLTFRDTVKIKLPKRRVRVE